jgi:hypothetical protein
MVPGRMLEPSRLIPGRPARQLRAAVMDLDPVMRMGKIIPGRAKRQPRVIVMARVTAETEMDLAAEKIMEPAALAETETNPAVTTVGLEMDPVVTLAVTAVSLEIQGEMEADLAVIRVGAVTESKRKI